MRNKWFELDSIRRGATALQGHAIDELLAGRVDRRAFLRYGSVMGLGLPAMGSLLTGIGSVVSSPARAASALVTGDREDEDGDPGREGSGRTHEQQRKRHALTPR